MRRAGATLALAGLALAGCGSQLPAGVDETKLDTYVSEAIGDPNTCVLIGRAGSGDVVWRYNTHTTCGRTLPACDGQATQTVGDLLKATAQDGAPRRLSCDSSPDGSRGVGWASGPIPGHKLVYAAVMEGQRALPGLIMADKLESALQDAGFKTASR